MTGQDLKNSILQLAIQGKLVEQREEEGTAKELLEKIEAEKKQLIKEKVIKRQKNLAEITEEEIDFDIPENWEWTRLESITYNIGNKSNQIKQSEILQEGRYPVVSQSMNRIEGYSNEEKKLLRIKPLSVIVFGDHSKTLKLISFDFIIGADGTKIMVPISINPEYLFYVLSYNVINMKDRGYSRHFQFLKERLIPLPPLEEQKRIVARIEELMPYVDKYDVAYSEVEKLNKKFPEDMQKSILQYAIQGKLVEQREEDGTAKELLEKIEAEKKQLIKEKVIKRQKNLPEVTEEEIDFEIPQSWEWTRLEAITYSIGNKSNQIKQSEMLQEGRYPVVSQSMNRIEGYSNEENKLLMIKPLSVIVFGDHSKTLKLIDFDFIIGADGTKIMVPISIDPKYLYYVLNYNVINMRDRGYSRHFQFLKERLIPLPPLAEQKRIVEKIEELLPYTKQLVK